MFRPARVAAWLVFLLAAGTLALYLSAQAQRNLIEDPSFEIAKPKDQAGRVFAKWEGWKYEGECGFEVGKVAHSGKTSALLACMAAGKIRINQAQELEPGRYRIVAYIQGLDIGVGQWDHTTVKSRTRHSMAYRAPRVRSTIWLPSRLSVSRRPPAISTAWPGSC